MLNRRCLLIFGGIAWLLLVPPLAAQSPFPAADGVLANGSTLALSSARINRDFVERIGQPFGLEGLVLAVASCRPDPEVYLDGALPHYGLASRAGQLNDRAIVFLVCQEPRFAGFFYAANNPYAERLDHDRVSTVMTDHLAAGDYTGAITAAIGQVARDLGAADVRPTGGVESVGTPPRRSWAEDARTGGALLIASAIGALTLFMRQRRKTQRAKASATGPEAELRTKMAELERVLRRDSPAFSRLVLAYEMLGDEAVLELHRRHEAMLARLAELQRQSEGLTSGVVPAAMAQEPEALAQRYAGPLAEADALLEYARALENEADQVARWIDRAPVLLVEARQALTDARQSYEAQAVQLDLASPAGLFGHLEAIVAAGEAALSAGDRITAGRLAEAGRSAAESVRRLVQQLQAAEERIAAAAERFNAADRYAPASWADIRGNGTEAEASLATARQQLARIAEAESGAFGPDLAGGLLTSLDRVAAEVARATELATAIINRFAALERAKSEVAAMLGEARSELAEAHRWLAEPAVDADVDAKPSETLAQAEALIEHAATALLQPAPDFPAVLRELRQARDLVDAALAEGRDQRTRMAFLQQQLAAAAAEAEEAIGRAEQYYLAHAADIGPAARSRLEAARTQLRKGREEERHAMSHTDADRLTSLRRATDLFAEATDLATEAYELMARDFDAAEAQRQPDLPRPQWAGPMVPVPNVLPELGRLLRNVPTEPVRSPPTPGRWGSRAPGSWPSGESSRRGGGRGW